MIPSDLDPATIELAVIITCEELTDDDAALCCTAFSGPDPKLPREALADALERMAGSMAADIRSGAAYE